MKRLKSFVLLQHLEVKFYIIGENPDQVMVELGKILPYMPGIKRLKAKFDSEKYISYEV